MSKRMVIMAIIVIAVGVCWLLNTLNVLEGVEWVWTGMLCLAGVLVLAIGGLNKSTAVLGPFLIIASIFEVMRQVGRFPPNREIPSLVIVLGVLMLIAAVAPLPTPLWMREEQESDSPARDEASSQPPSSDNTH